MNSRSISVWRERLTSPLSWHIAGFALLLLLVAILAVQFGLDWVAIDSRSSNALAGKQVELKAMELETVPLHGLDKHVEDSRAQLQNFYAKRIPASYSAIATRIGDLQVKSGVRLSQLQYTQGKPKDGLTEISMEAGISGAYPAIMHFINSVERDRTFFVIRAMSLTGEQGGLVNLRIRISTWLRPADAAASGLPATSNEKKGESTTSGQANMAKEGK